MAQVAGAGPSLRPILLEQILAKADRQAALLDLLHNEKITAKQLGAVELKRFCRSGARSIEGWLSNAVGLDSELEPGGGAEELSALLGIGWQP